MRRLVFTLLGGLVLTPLPVHAQGSVTLNVCNTGTVDIDVFVSPAGNTFSSHIRPATCAVVAESEGGTEPAYVGLAFTDAKGQWGAARRLSTFPTMGVKEIPLVTRLAMNVRGEPVPRPPNVLSLATRSQTVQHGGASVSLPMQLLFQPSLPECRNVSTGGGATIGNTTFIETTTICEDLGYTLKVEAYPDSREIRLGALGTSGFFSDGPLGTTIIGEKTEMDWAEEEANRKAREAPVPVNWSDLLQALRPPSRPSEVLPPYITVRGTVARIEMREVPIDANNANNVQMVDVVFRESPFVSLRPDWAPYSEFDVCTSRLDILQEVFGADFRTSMIGKTIEVRAGDFINTVGSCRGLLRSIQIVLARQVRPVPSAQFASGTRVWVPPPVVAPPPRPAPTPAEIEADIVQRANIVTSQVELKAKSRMSDACVAQQERGLAANPGNRDAIVKEYFACQGAVSAEARRESQKAQACAEQVIRADPANPDGTSRDPEGLQRALLVCTQAPAPAVAAAPAPKPAAAPVAAPPAPAPTRPTAAAPTTTGTADPGAARAAAVRDQQQRAQQAKACMEQLFKTYPDGGRSDPAGFQKGFLACAQAQQPQPAK